MYTWKSKKKKHAYHTSPFQQNVRTGPLMPLYEWIATVTCTKVQNNDLRPCCSGNWVGSDSGHLAKGQFVENKKSWRLESLSCSPKSVCSQCILCTSQAKSIRNSGRKDILYSPQSLTKWRHVSGLKHQQEENLNTSVLSTRRYAHPRKSCFFITRKMLFEVPRKWIANNSRKIRKSVSIFGNFWEKIG